MVKKILFLLFIITLTSCENLKNGNVVKKWYSPPSIQPILVPVTVGNSTTIQQYLVYNGEDYCIEVKGLSNKGNMITQTFYLNRIQWDTITVGEFVCVDGMCDEDQNNSKQ